MEKLFGLLEKHANDILEYRLSGLFDDSIKRANSGIQHVPDDLLILNIISRFGIKMQNNYW